MFNFWPFKPKAPKPPPSRIDLPSNVARTVTVNHGRGVGRLPRTSTRVYIASEVQQWVKQTPGCWTETTWTGVVRVNFPDDATMVIFRLNFDFSKLHWER